MTDIKGIRIDFIPHESQNYSTCGDYFIDENGYLNIKVSKMGNTAYGVMVAIHELVEWLTTDMRGLSEQEITKFDLMFEEEAKYGKHPELDEPGFDNRAPYLREHTLSTSIEMMLCAFMGISWKDYDDFVMNLT